MLCILLRSGICLDALPGVTALTLMIESSQGSATRRFSMIMRHTAPAISQNILGAVVPPRSPSECLKLLIQRSRPLPLLRWLQAAPRIQARAKSKVTKKLADLPQGVVVGKGLPDDHQDDGPSYPAVVQQAWNNMQRFEDCVVLTRVGSFYEVGLKWSPMYNRGFMVLPAVSRTCR